MGPESGGGIDGGYSPIVRSGIQLAERRAKYAVDFTILVGLETVFAIGDHWANVTGDEQQRKNTDFLKEHYLDKGKLGVKSGEGFFRYPDPEFMKSDFLK